MTDEEYSQVQQELLVLARWVHGLDLDAFLHRIRQAETIAPILDPTLYLRGGQQLHQIKRLAQSLRPFQDEIRRQMEINQDGN